MKKIILVNILILTLFLGGLAEADEKPGYGNLSFIVWKSDKGLSDAGGKHPQAGGGASDLPARL